MGHNFPPPPLVFQINCGGLGGGALEGEVPPHFHCMCPPVGESQVYGPSLSPADVLNDQEWGVACGWSTGVDEVATLFALTRWLLPFQSESRRPNAWGQQFGPGEKPPLGV